jgi:hypothetical protein
MPPSVTTTNSQCDRPRYGNRSHPEERRARDIVLQGKNLQGGGRVEVRRFLGVFRLHSPCTLVCQNLWFPYLVYCRMSSLLVGLLTCLLSLTTSDLHPVITFEHLVGACVGREKIDQTGFEPGTP